jgi:prevent-host-death family protein
MRSVNVTELREHLAKLVDAVESGEEIVILRRDRGVARLVPMERAAAPFLDRSELRAQMPPMTEPAERMVCELRDEERY